MAESIMFPPGRMIGGSVDKMTPKKDDAGNPKLDKAGLPVKVCSVCCAIPKKPGETHWNQTEWGKKVYAIGKAGHPLASQSPAFSWKITDGDSTVPNTKGKPPCLQRGYAGNWVIWFSTELQLPKRCIPGVPGELPEGAIVPGYYIQVAGSCSPNVVTGSGKPGVYLNPEAVALRGEGERLVTEVDTTLFDFSGDLPPEARPLSGAGMGFSVETQPVVTPAPTVSAPPSVPVVPNPAFLKPAPTMTAKAAGATYEAFVAQGWSDEQLRANGYMQ